MGEILPIEDKLHWYAMRDPKRRHAKLPVYKMSENLKVQCFTPTAHRLVVVGGKRADQEVSLMQDLLLMKDTREYLGAVVESTPKLQYRYKLGVQRTPITVPVADIERFIRAVEANDSPKLYSPDEVAPEMRNRKTRIIGEQLDEHAGTLVTARGSKIERLLAEPSTLLAASIEVETEYIQLIP